MDEADDFSGRLGDCFQTLPDVSASSGGPGESQDHGADYKLVSSRCRSQNVVLSYSLLPEL